MTLDANKNDEKLLTTIQQEYKILAEYKMIESEKIGGVYVIPSFGNSLLWYGVIFVRPQSFAKSAYTDGIFRFTILLPDRFPDDKTLPSVIFQTDVIHPLICPYTGNLDITHAFPYWRTGEDHIWQLLKYIQAIFMDPIDCCKRFSTASNKFMNNEAAELLQQNPDEFVTRVKNCIELCKSRLYDEPPPTNDPHYIVFEQYQSDLHGPVLESIRRLEQNAVSSQQPPASSNGLSWVKEGEFKPLSVE